MHTTFGDDDFSQLLLPNKPKRRHRRVFVVRCWLARSSNAHTCTAPRIFNEPSVRDRRRILPHGTLARTHTLTSAESFIHWGEVKHKLQQQRLWKERSFSSLIWWNAEIESNFSSSPEYTPTNTIAVFFVFISHSSCLLRRCVLHVIFYSLSHIHNVVVMFIRCMSSKSSSSSRTARLCCISWPGRRVLERGKIRCLVLCSNCRCRCCCCRWL